jgi:hypothetical protein
MSASRRKPILPPQMLLEIAETGGSIPADMKAVAVRFGLPRRRASEHIAQLARRELLARNAERPFYDIAPKGWAWIESYNPTAAKPSPPSSAPPTQPPPKSPAPPRSSSAPPPRPVRDRPHVRVPALTHKEMLLRKQDNEIHILRTIRHFNGVLDNTEHIDRGRLYRAREELGADLGVTVGEYLQFKTTKSFPSSFIPAGLDERQAKAIRDKVTRPARAAAESKRKQAKAAAKVATRQTVADLDCRASAVYLVLTDQPQTLVELMKALTGLPAFRRADGKGPLTGNSLRVAILRELRKPALAGRVEKTQIKHANGLTMDLYRRRDSGLFNRRDAQNQL